MEDVPALNSHAIVQGCKLVREKIQIADLGLVERAALDEMLRAAENYSDLSAQHHESRAMNLELSRATLEAQEILENKGRPEDLCRKALKRLGFFRRAERLKRDYDFFWSQFSVPPAARNWYQRVPIERFNDYKPLFELESVDGKHGSVKTEIITLLADVHDYPTANAARQALSRQGVENLPREV